MFFNYAWFREQTCLVVCPYGRLQSALIDSDTIIVGYDGKRGEPRSKVSDEGGDCVDCHRCVVVCPTGIDIRNGLQMECIGCANCVDACDEIMGKLGKPRGLVRYDSKRGLEEGRRRKLVRPRSVVYAVLGLIGLTVFAGAASRRESFEVKVLRAKGMPYILEETTIRNLYTLRIENKEARDRVFFLEVEAEPPEGTPEPEFIVSQGRVFVAAMGNAEVPVFATIPRGTFSVPFPVEFAVTDSASGREREAEVRFRGP
jgi:cytochrome c oxidase accessory protein FixG